MPGGRPLARLRSTLGAAGPPLLGAPGPPSRALPAPAWSGAAAAAVLGTGPCCLVPRLLVGLLLLPGAGCGRELASAPVKDLAGCAGELLGVGTLGAAGGCGAGAAGSAWGESRAAVLLPLGCALIFEAQHPPGVPAAVADNGVNEPVDDGHGAGTHAGLYALHHGIPVQPLLTQAA